MGLLDQLEGGPLGDGAANGGRGQVMGAVLQMLQGQAGGIGGVLSSFEHAGLGGVAQSWINEGPNQPVSPEQVTQALSGPVEDLASKLGVSHQEAAGHLAGMLPQMMDHLSPGGQAPADGGHGGLGGLSQFGGGADAAVPHCSFRRSNSQSLNVIQAPGSPAKATTAPKGSLRGRPLASKSATIGRLRSSDVTMRRPGQSISWISSDIEQPPVQEAFGRSAYQRLNCGPQLVPSSSLARRPAKRS